MRPMLRQSLCLLGPAYEFLSLGSFINKANGAVRYLNEEPWLIAKTAGGIGDIRLGIGLNFIQRTLAISLES